MNIEEIQAKTKTIISALSACSSVPCGTACDDCPYFGDDECDVKAQNNAIAMIEYLTAELEAERAKNAEYRQAEADGLLVVLPCKVGSDVWLVLPDYTECSVYREKYNEASCAGCEEGKCDSSPTKTIKRIKNAGLISLAGWIASECFGKTVFLTHEAAEAALEGARG